MQATLNNWRGSPRKFNEYLRAVRGLRAIDAANRLQFLPSPYAQALRGLILSAVANASEDAAVVPTNLVVKEATTGRAMFFKRVCFRGRGRTGRVTKFGSNVRVVLDIAAQFAKSKDKVKNTSKEEKVSKKIPTAKNSVKKSKEANNG